jgi:hypothetical protein
MSKKMKLNLEHLKVQSFVTSLNREESKKAVGGEEAPVTPNCTYGCTDWLCGHTQVPTGNPCRVCD